MAATIPLQLKGPILLPNTITENELERRQATGGREPHQSVLHRRYVVALLGGLWFLLGCVLLTAGPFLNSHETIVAQVARQSLRDGDWIVPRYLDAPFLVKPPLNPWLAAVAGYLLPADRLTGLPVSTAAARLPSLVAMLLTAWIVRALGSSMYGRRAGTCAAIVYATSAGTLAFALNATSEALLTLFCAWAYAEFWWSRQTDGRGRTLHQIRFYIAFALAMMAKAPMPLVVVGVPLAVWWWTERPVRLWADSGLRAARGPVRLFGRDLPERTLQAFTDLGIWWGIPAAFSLLLLWMWAVSHEVPYIWQLWDSEYLHRLEDQKLWGGKAAWYYFPLIFGFTAPWLLSMPEALIGPFLARYRRERRGMLYAWYWVVVSLALLSSMHFKQDYYLVPLLPACALLLGPVLDRLFLAPAPLPARRTVLAIRVCVAAVMVAAPIASYLVFRSELAGWSSRLANALLASICVVSLACVAFAARKFITGRRPTAFFTVAFCGFAVFSLVWVAEGLSPHLRDHAALARKLNEAGVGEDDKVYWADSVPDGRLTFYYNRRIRQLVDPFELRAGLRGEDKETVMLSMASKICTILEGSEDVYFIFERSRYGLLKSFGNPKGTVLFEVDRLPRGRDKDDWVVVTNR